MTSFHLRMMVSMKWCSQFYKFQFDLTKRILKLYHIPYLKNSCNHFIVKSDSQSAQAVMQPRYTRNLCGTILKYSVLIIFSSYQMLTSSQLSLYLQLVPWAVKFHGSAIGAVKVFSKINHIQHLIVKYQVFFFQSSVNAMYGSKNLWSWLASSTYQPSWCKNQDYSFWINQPVD